MGKFLKIIAITCFVSLNALAGLEAPPLHYMSFKDVNYPSYITKAEIHTSLQTIMDNLYGIGFVDMGDISDLMHGHMILASNGKQPDAKLKPVAVLYHSQEYDFFRKGKPYQGPYGNLDSYHRNWVLFLEDRSPYKRGDVVDANLLMEKPADKKVYTIRVSDLDPKIFGFDRIEDESYYFFRTDCHHLEGLPTTEESNVVEIQNKITQTNVCLVLVSFNCRNYPEKKECQSETVLPSYDIQLLNY